MPTELKGGFGSARSQCGPLGLWKSSVRTVTGYVGAGIREYIPPVISVSDTLWPYRRSLELHVELLDTLRTHDVSFETSRKTANTWVEQPCLEDDSWDAKWDALCEVEVDRWDSR